MKEDDNPNDDAVQCRACEEWCLEGDYIIDDSGEALCHTCKEHYRIPESSN